jgi:hypothetical protein
MTVRHTCWAETWTLPPAPAAIMMEPLATKFADAEKVPRFVLPVVRWQGQSVYLMQLQKMPSSAISKRSAEQSDYDRTARVMARNRLQALVSANVRFGSKADICSAKGHVRFIPISDRESRFPQKIMSALPPKADMCGALADVCFGPIADIDASIRSPRRRGRVPTAE